MLTTHIGSLPFISIDQAFEYTFAFDIPVLFTLPKIYHDELMHLHVASSLELGKFDEQQLILNDTFDDSQELSSRYQESFFRKMKIYDRDVFKYQLIGPVSLYLLTDQSHCFSHFCTFLLDKYTSYLSQLSKNYKLIFLLDEPILFKEFSKYKQELNDFMEQLSLRVTNIEVGLHLCCKLNVDQLNELCCRYLNIDTTLYSQSELSRVNNKSFLGVISTDGTISKTATNNPELLLNTKIISPTCGLALQDSEVAQRVFRELKKVAHLNLS